uniref:Uncharacterized protein n=1 Tax=Arundo donax TaxID=35708 RepID=A0A0A8Y999_ARUDO
MCNSLQPHNRQNCRIAYKVRVTSPASPTFGCFSV